ncbi:MAG: thermonuclease family protein [Actinomycetota bacterium]|nr:thermonuclease family protein [Actinomycetota bacterium]
MRSVAAGAALALLISCGGGSVSLGLQAPPTLREEPSGSERARVTRVIDGDTIEVVILSRSEGRGAGWARPGQTYSVRLTGIDTPESVKPDSPVECFGRESSAALEAFVGNRVVRLVDDVENVDGYDRLLRYVYVGEEMANARLVVNGYAHAYPYAPNLRHSRLFEELQRDARKGGRGLWSSETCDGDP